MRYTQGMKLTSATGLIRGAVLVVVVAGGVAGMSSTAGAATPDYPPAVTISPVAPTTTVNPVKISVPSTGSDATRSGSMLAIGSIALGGGLLGVSRARRRQEPAS